MKNNKVNLIIIYLVIILCISLYIPLRNYAVYSFANRKSNPYSILVDLVDKRLYLIDANTGKAIKYYPIASGKSSTPSPIGTWQVVSKGKWGGAFSTGWLGLNVPWGKYGIHGTNNPHSIGNAASHGCIRMLNKDIEDLYNYIDLKTSVIIYGGPYGAFGNSFRLIKPGDTGSDVYEIQKIMKAKGYYPASLDGSYGDTMKEYVIKFRINNNLRISHYIDMDFYKALEIKDFE